MKKFKTIICFLLVSLISVSAIGCNNSEDKGTEEVSVSWYLPISNQPDGDLVVEKLSEITKEKIGVSLELQFIDLAAYKERMTMNMASGTEYDICFSGYLNPYETGVANGSLMGLSDMLNEHTPKLRDSIPQYAWDVASVDGEIYAVPNLQGYAGPNALYFFNDLVQKYKFDLSTINIVNDVEPYLQTIKENEPGIIPWRVAYGTGLWYADKYENVTSDFVIRSDGSSPEVMLVYDTPEYKEAVKKLNEWYNKGYIRSDLLTAGSDIQDLNAGKYAVSQSLWLPGAEATATQSMGTDIKLVPISKPYMTRKSSISAMSSIGIDSKHPIEALKVLELVNTDVDFLNLITLGIEGKHYTLDADGKYELISGSGYKTSGAWLFGNQFNQILAVGQDDDVWEQTKVMNDEAIKSPLLGFTFNPDPVKDKISQVAAVLSEYILGTQIVNGYADYETIMEKLKIAGIEEYKAEVQRQVNEYWTANNK